MFILRGKLDGFENYKDLIASGLKLQDQDLNIRYQQVDTYDVCNIQYTSGSTGSPKAAMLTHQYVIGRLSSLSALIPS